MIDKERIRKALEVIAEESDLISSEPDKLYATKKKTPEIETEDGLINVGMNYEGTIEIKSPLGPKIRVRLIHKDITSKTICPEGAVYVIRTMEQINDLDSYQPGVCYVDQKGLVVKSEKNVRINPKTNID